MPPFAGIIVLVVLGLIGVALIWQFRPFAPRLDNRPPEVIEKENRSRIRFQQEKQRGEA
jgi:hypothetical protein